MEAAGSGGLEGTGPGAGEEETGMEARGGEGGRAGRLVAEEGAAWIRLSSSSMSDYADDGGARSCRRGCATWQPV
jgi:hypothetical protein